MQRRKIEESKDPMVSVGSGCKLKGTRPENGWRFGNELSADAQRVGR